MIWNYFKFIEMFQDKYKEFLPTLHWDSLTSKNLPHLLYHPFCLYTYRVFLFCFSEPFGSELKIVSSFTPRYRASLTSQDILFHKHSTVLRLRKFDFDTGLSCSLQFMCPCPQSSLLSFIAMPCSSWSSVEFRAICCLQWLSSLAPSFWNSFSAALLHDPFLSEEYSVIIL